MSSVATGQMSAVETGQMSAVETGQLSAVETGQMSAVETRQMYSSGTTSSPGLRRPRQRPTKSMTANLWLAEAAIAADQKVYMVPWMTQVWQPNKIDTAIY